MRELYDLCVDERWESAHQLLALLDTASATANIHFNSEYAPSIYYAIAKNAPLRLIQLIEERSKNAQAAAQTEAQNAAPTACSTLMKYNRLPLHYAAICSSSIETVQYLISQHPLALTTRDLYGRIPGEMRMEAIRSEPRNILTISSLLRESAVAVMCGNYGEVGRLCGYSDALFKLCAMHIRATTILCLKHYAAGGDVSLGSGLDAGLARRNFVACEDVWRFVILAFI
jgi:hypothetical protein